MPSDPGRAPRGATTLSRFTPVVLLLLLIVAVAVPVLAFQEHALFLPLTRRGPVTAPTQIVTPVVTPCVTPSVTPDDIPGWLIGEWSYFASAGSIGFGDFPTFREDGTFNRTVVAIAGSTYYLTSFDGKYRVAGNRLVFYDRLKGTATAYSWEEIWRLTQSLVEDVPVEDEERTFGQTPDGDLYMSFVDPDTGEDVTTEYSRDKP